MGFKFHHIGGRIGCGIVLALLAGQVAAAGFRLPNQSALATARGNAHLVAVEEASAVYYNPAALGELDDEELEVGLYSIDFGVSLERPSGADFETDNGWQHVPQLFYAKPGESLSWGFGIYAPFGLGNDWGQDTDFRTLTTEASITYLTASPVVAWQLTPNLSIGGGLTINHMTADLRQGLGFSPGDEFRFEGDDTSLGFVLAALWQPHPKHSFGALYRSAQNHELEGEARVSPFVLPPNAPSRTDSQGELSVPDHLILGYAWEPNPLWELEFDIEWGNWSRFDRTRIDNTPIGDVPLVFDWEDGFIYQLGATRHFEGYSLSAGYDYNQGVQPDANYTPAVSDGDRHWFNIGVSGRHASVRWSLAYQYGMSDHSVSGSQASAAGQDADGDYQSRVHALVISLGYRL